jgi:Tfp pilus assembly protein PilP
MRSAITLGLGILIAAATPGLRAQVNPSTPNSVKSALGGAGKPAQQAAKPATPAATKPTPQTAKPAAPAASKPAQQAAKPATPAATKPTPQTAKPAAPAASKPAPAAAKAAGKPAGKAVVAAAQRAAKPAAKPAAKATGKSPAKPAVKAVEKAATPGSAPAAAESEVKQARRDPFESLLGRQLNKAPANLPPGKLGLQVSTLRLDGIVRAPNGMIAVVSNPQARTYFLREGDRLYDGSVEKISMDGVSFHEEGKDAFGKPVERQVNKRIYSSPGEQQ